MIGDAFADCIAKVVVNQLLANMHLFIEHFVVSEVFQLNCFNGFMLMGKVVATIVSFRILGLRICDGHVGEHCVVDAGRYIIEVSLAICT